MSYERGLKALNLEMPDTIPHTEYCSHPELVLRLTGLDPRKKEEEEQAWQEFVRVTDYDFLWVTDDGPEWKGRTTSMGHAEFMEGGTDYNPDIHCPFKTAEEVLSFDPVKEYGLPDINERAPFFAKSWQKTQKNFPTVVVPGGYYKTIVSACIQSFGWEMFLEAAGVDYERFDKVLEGFFQISIANYKAWSLTPIRFFICHDDMVWTEGAIFHPEWYRKYVFPRYKKLWQILKEKGIKVIFCSDGCYTEFIDDIADAGAEGFILESLTDLEYMASGYGKTHVIIGNIDVRALTFGTKEDVEKEVSRCANIGIHLPGYFFAVGNHIPHNVPIENALYYLDLIKKCR